MGAGWVATWVAALVADEDSWPMNKMPSSSRSMNSKLVDTALEVKRGFNKEVPLSHGKACTMMCRRLRVRVKVDEALLGPCGTALRLTARLPRMLPLAPAMRQQVPPPAPRTQASRAGIGAAVAEVVAFTPMVVELGNVIDRVAVADLI
jgi:hypothetical protein